MRGLVIKTPWIDLIIAGQKRWEIRSRASKIRGEIALIRSGSGSVVATCCLSDCLGPLTLEELQIAQASHCVPLELLSQMGYRNFFAWVLEDVRQVSPAGSYRHPIGAVTWVNLDGQPVLESLARSEHLFQEVIEPIG